MSFNNFYLLEDFKTVKDKWIKAIRASDPAQADAMVGELDELFKKYKKMKALPGFLTADEANIDWWGKNSDVVKFATFFDKKNKELEEKKKHKEVRKEQKNPSIIADNEYVTVYFVKSFEASREICGKDENDPDRPPWCIASTNPKTAEIHWRGLSGGGRGYVGKQGLTPYYVFFKGDNAFLRKYGRDYRKLAIMIKPDVTTFKGVSSINSIWNVPNSNVLQRVGEDLIETLKGMDVPVEKLVSRTSKITHEDADMGVPPWKMKPEQIEEFLKKYTPTKSGGDYGKGAEKTGVHLEFDDLDDAYDVNRVPEKDRINMKDFEQFFKDEPSMIKHEQLGFKFKGKKGEEEATEARHNTNYEFFPTNILSTFQNWLGRSLKTYETKPIKDIFKVIDKGFAKLKEEGEEERQKEISKLRGNKEVYHIK
jgi:hypothetical protein